MFLDSNSRHWYTRGVVVLFFFDPFFASNIDIQFSECKVPTIYALMTRHLREKCSDAERAAAVAGMQRLRLMVSGSAACPVPLMNEWEEITGHRLLER